MPLATEPPPSDQIVPSPIFDRIWKCWSEKSLLPWPIENQKPDFKLEDLVASISGQPIMSQLIFNMHVQKFDGTKWRLHVSPFDPSKPSFKIGEASAQVFSVDQENLPVPMDWPSELNSDDVNTLMERFSSMGEVTWQEKRYHLQWESQLSADIFETNGSLSELQIFFEAGSLACNWTVHYRDLNCQCL